jgi:hypothetical protein
MVGSLPSTARGVGRRSPMPHPGSASSESFQTLRSVSTGTSAKGGRHTGRRRGSSSPAKPRAARVDGRGDRGTTHRLHKAGCGQSSPLRLHPVPDGQRQGRFAPGRGPRARLARLRASQGCGRPQRSPPVDAPARAGPTKGGVATAGADLRRARADAARTEDGSARQERPGIRLADRQPTLASHRRAARL